MAVSAVLRNLKRDIIRLLGKDNHLYYFEEFPSWEKAELRSSEYGKSYQGSDILNKVADATNAVRRGEALYEQDGVLFYKENNNYELIAALLYVFANRKKLDVIDFGGALGSTFFRYRKLLESCNPHWEIVEQSHYVDYGKRNIPEIRFHHLIDACRQDADIILFSGVLAYLPDPYAMFGACLDKGMEFVIIDETAFTQDDRDIIMLQHVPESIYKAVYPLHLFSYSNFKEFIDRKGYEILWDWDYRFGNIPTKKGFHYKDTIEKGFLLRRKSKV